MAQDTGWRSPPGRVRESEAMPDTEASSTERPFSPGIAAIFEVVARLRAPGGCPWDREQTHESLRPYLLEETYELLEAIDQADDAKVREELGDVLLQVAMHAEIAAEQGRFDAAQVSEAVAAKMVKRHPHVFGTASVADADEVLRNWEHQKHREARTAGSEESVVDRVPASLPALAWTLALQKRAARVGFDYPSPLAAGEAVAEEARELASSDDPKQTFDELGDLLFAVVALARTMHVNPEDALRVSGQRFRRRFAAMEESLRKDGLGFQDVDAKELLVRWEQSR
jgi:tetrapyrrole methylase family protein / MazG family protein